MGIYDKDIRKLLLEDFFKKPQFISDDSTVVINELDVCGGSAIADIAVVNGKIHGFEIKSEHDTLDRLQTQVEFYNLVFDTVTLVVSSKHLSNALDKIPDWWGVYSVNKISSKHYEIVEEKEPTANQSVNAFHLSQMLWKNELIGLLNQNGKVKGVKSKTRKQLSELVSELVDLKDIQAYVRNMLKNRESWKAHQLKQLDDGLQQL